jgi:flagellar biosynthesis/type III secretory pathway protein FliH
MTNKDDKRKTVRDLLNELNASIDAESMDILAAIKQRGNEDYKQGYSNGYHAGIRELQRLLDAGQLTITWTNNLL